MVWHLSIANTAAQMPHWILDDTLVGVRVRAWFAAADQRDADGNLMLR